MSFYFPVSGVVLKTCYSLLTGKGGLINRRCRLSVLAVDPVFQDVRRAEHQNAARQDWHFDTGFRVAAHALALLADREAAERRNLDVIAPDQRLWRFRPERLPPATRTRCGTSPTCA
jgi:hypothetical protein